MAKLKTGNVKIPMSLLEKIICMLECLAPDLDEYDPMLVEDYDDIVLALNDMKKSIELRDNFTRIVNDCSYEIRWASRMERARNKRYEADLPF